jgi:phosphatidylglycerol---prolipoprotein diacylglyceryl transferase
MHPVALAPLSLIPWFRLEPWPVPLPGVGEVAIQPFGVLAAMAIMLGTAVAQRRADKTGVPRALVDAFLTRVISVGLVSAAVLNVLMYEPEKVAQMGRAVASWFASDDRQPFPYPGLSSFGGFFGGTMAASWFRHRRKVSLLVLGDLFCYAIPFAWILARSGCFVVHDHPGIASDFFLAVDDYNGEGVARHDLGLYEVLWSIVMSGVVYALGRKPRPWGFFVALVTLAYAPLRFCLDFLRAAPDDGGDVRYLGLTPGQYAAVAMLLASIAVAVRVARGPVLERGGSSPYGRRTNSGSPNA